MSKYILFIFISLALLLNSCNTECISGIGQVTVYNNTDYELYVEVISEGNVIHRTNLYVGDYQMYAIQESQVTVRTKESGKLFQPNYQMVSFTHQGCRNYDVTAHSDYDWNRTHYLELDRNL